MERHSPMEHEIVSVSLSSDTSSNRLGKCEVCGAKDAKYTCPKCEVKTCSLPCLRIHKKELSCNGIRDRTKFIALKKMTKMDFMSDYYFLEECTRFMQDRKHDRLKRYTRFNKVLPATLFRLRNAAASRKVTLRFLLENFSRRKENTSYLNWKSEIIYWRVDWIFINAGNLIFTDKRCCEEETLAKLLDKYVNSENPEVVPKKKCLEYYQSQSLCNLSVLLKAEGVRKCRNRFYRLDCTQTLKENLCGKVIVEYPCIYVTYDKDNLNFNLIDNDDDLEAEVKSYQTTLEKLVKSSKCDLKFPYNGDSTKSEKELQKQIIEKKRTERRIKREQFEKEASNYLFSDEKLWDDISSSSNSEGGDITEEDDSPGSSSNGCRKR